MRVEMLRYNVEGRKKVGRHARKLQVSDRHSKFLDRILTESYNF